MLSHYDYAKIGELCLVKSISEVEAICHNTLNVFGVKYFRYRWQYSEPIKHAPQVVMLTGCPSAWIEHYQNMGYGAIDPKCEYVRRNTIMAVWEPGSSLANVSARERQFWEDSIDFGLGYGATIPIPSKLGGKASLCLAFSLLKGEREHSLSCMPSIESFAFRLHEVVERLTIPNQTAEVSLTEREIEVVRWAAIGKTAYETGRILAISETTVLFHLNNAKRKLGVVKKHQLTARALAVGII